MPPNNEISPELTELEAALRTLSPRASRIDRDRLLYEAGRAAALAEVAALRPIRLRAAFWPSVSAALAVACLVLAVQWWRVEGGGWRDGLGEGRIVQEIHRNPNLVSQGEGAPQTPLPLREGLGEGQNVRVGHSTAEGETRRQGEGEGQDVRVGHSSPRLSAHGERAHNTASGYPTQPPRQLPPDPTYPVLRDFILAYGVDALPVPSAERAAGGPIATPTLDSRELLRRILREQGLNGERHNSDRPSAPASNNWNWPDWTTWLLRGENT